MKLYNFSATWFGMVFSMVESMMVSDKEVIHDTSKLPSQDVNYMWEAPVWIDSPALMAEFEEFMATSSPYRDVLLEYLVKKLQIVTYTFQGCEAKLGTLYKRNPRLLKTIQHFTQRAIAWQLDPVTSVSVELLKRGWRHHPDRAGWYLNIFTKKVGKGNEARDLYRVNRGILESTILAMFDDHASEGNVHGIAGITPDVRFDLYDLISKKEVKPEIQAQVQMALDYTDTFEQQWAKDSSIVTQLKKRMALTR